MLLQLRFLLSIPPTSEAVFERFSDSAAAFVVLDPNNASVYKQLYRAAKAKLKLRIKVTIKDKEPVTPKPATVEDEEPSPVSPVSLPSLIPGHDAVPLEAARQAPSVVEQPQFSNSVNELQDKFEDLLINHHPRFFQGATTPMASTHSFASQLQREFSRAQVAEPPKTTCCTATEIPVTHGAAARDRWYAELAAVSDQRQTAVRSSTPSGPCTRSIFSVYCNNCTKSIPDEHFHCSTCDDGDFDLCTACVKEGVLCGGDDHWMIKRVVQNGHVISSTTEKLPPKSIASESKTTLVQLAEEEETATRTCNACIAGKSASFC